MLNSAKRLKLKNSFYLLYIQKPSGNGGLFLLVAKLLRDKVAKFSGVLKIIFVPYEILNDLALDVAV